MKLGIQCTACKKKDFMNKFKLRTVLITTKHDNQFLTTTKQVVCARCKNCGKILFEDMKVYKKLKEELDAYYKLKLNSEDFEHVKIELK